MSSSLNFCWVSLCAALLGACHATAGTRVQSDMRVFEHEQTPDRLIQRGRAFAAVGDTLRAEQYLAAAREAGGDETAITPMLVTLCVRDGRYRMAVEHARRYLERHPDDDKMRFVLGTLYAALHEGEDAARELELVAKTSGENPEVQYALAVVERDGGDVFQADRHFREYLRLAPRGEHAEEARSSVLEETP